MAIINYGSAKCAGSSSGIGVNNKGWYATGQLYAMAQASLDFDYWLGSVTLLGVQVGMVLKAGGPNPTYAVGSLGGKATILGCSKSFKFDINIGERCQFETDSSGPLLSLISDIVPEEGTHAVRPDVAPSINFNYPIDEEIVESDKNNNTVKYKMLIDTILFTHNNDEIEYEKFVDFTTNTDMNLFPKDMLTSNDSFTVFVKASLYKNDVFSFTESKTVTFYTTEYGEELLASNIVRSYPIDGQYNFYRQERPNHDGFISLWKGQPNLFLKDQDFKLKMKFTNKEQNTVEVDASYDFIDASINYSLPIEFIGHDKVYKMELIRYDKISNESTPANYSPFYAEDAAVSKQNDQYIAKLLYTAWFRSSNYNSSYEKMLYLKSQLTKVNTAVHDIAFSAQIEPFDGREMGIGYYGTSYFSLGIENSIWYNSINKLINDKNVNSLGYFDKKTGFYILQPLVNYSNLEISGNSWSISNANIGMAGGGANKTNTSVVTEFTIISDIEKLANISYSILRNKKFADCKELFEIQKEKLNGAPQYLSFCDKCNNDWVCGSDELPYMPNGDSTKLELKYTIPKSIIDKGNKKKEWPSSKINFTIYK